MADSVEYRQRRSRADGAFDHLSHTPLYPLALGLGPSLAPLADSAGALARPSEAPRRTNSTAEGLSPDQPLLRRAWTRRSPAARQIPPHTKLIT